jgi:hypothetical protein
MTTTLDDEQSAEFIATALMLVLVVLGLVHHRRTPTAGTSAA